MALGVSSSSAAGAAGGKSVTLGLTQAVATLNPLTANDSISMAAIQLMYDTLAWQSADQKYHPRLASSWSFSKNFKTATFKLNPKARWTNGTPVTANDVVTTFTYAANKATASPAAADLKYVVGTDASGYSLQPTRPLAGVKAVNKHTVRMRFKQPMDPDLVLFSIGANPFGFNVMPASVLKGVDPADVAKAGFSTHPTVTSGPFKFVSMTTGQSVTLARNPHYFLGVPKLNQVFIKNVPQTNFLPELKSGAVDVTAGPGIISNLQLQDWESASAISGLKAGQTPGTVQDAAFFNTKSPALADRKVRQALTMAVNRQQLVKQVLAGNGTVAVTQVNPESPFFDKAVKAYPYNPAQATAMLKAADFPFGTTLRILVATGLSTTAQSAQLIQQEWASVGVKATVQVLDFASWFGSIGKGDFDLAMVPSAYSNGGISDPGGTATFFSCKGSLNISKLCDPTIDAMYKVATVARHAVRKKAYFKLQQEVHLQQPIMFLYWADGLPAYSTRVNKYLVPSVVGLTQPWLWDVK